MLVFIPCVGEYVIPELLGGPQTQMIGRTLWDEFFSNNDWPMACAGRGGDGAADHRAAGGVQPLPGRGAGAAHVSRMSHGDAAFNRCVRPRLAVARLPLPLPADRRAGRLFSFNDSPVANVWRGFTLKWYAALATDRELLAGLWLSLKIAFVTACASVVLGTLAAFALVKLPALHRPHAVRRHGRGAAGDARGHHRPVAAADAGVAVQQAVARLSRARHADDLARPPAARHGLRHGGRAGAPAGR